MSHEPPQPPGPSPGRKPHRAGDYPVAGRFAAPPPPPDMSIDVLLIPPQLIAPPQPAIAPVPPVGTVPQVPLERLRGFFLRALVLLLLAGSAMAGGWFLVLGLGGTARRTEPVVAQVPDPAAPTTLDAPPTQPAATQPAPTATQPATKVLVFEQDVRPLLQTKCFSCHGANRKRSNLDLRTVASMLKGGDKGTALVPGSPDKSPMHELAAANKMPPKANRLSATEKTLLRDWIAGGAKDKADTVAKMKP